MKRLSLVLFVIFISCGCASYGNKAITNEEIISQIQIGKSTKEDIKALIGEPSEVTFNDLGDEDWSYIFSRTKTRASSFIPYVGLLAGGADTKTDTLKIRFDNNGIVKKIGKGQATGGAGSIFD